MATSKPKPTVIGSLGDFIDLSKIQTGGSSSLYTPPAPNKTSTPALSEKVVKSMKATEAKDIVNQATSKLPVKSTAVPQAEIQRMQLANLQGKNEKLRAPEPTRKLGGFLTNPDYTGEKFDPSTLSGKARNTLAEIGGRVIGVGEAMKKNVTATLDDTSERVMTLLKDLDSKNNDSPNIFSKRLASMGSVGIGAFNVTATPITAALEGAKEVPFLSPAAKSVEYLFGKAGEGGAWVASEVIDSLPIDEGTKEAIRPFVNELGATLAMVGTGKAAHVTGQKVGELRTVIKDKIIEGYETLKQIPNQQGGFVKIPEFGKKKPQDKAVSAEDLIKNDTPVENINIKEIPKDQTQVKQDAKELKAKETLETDKKNIANTTLNVDNLKISDQGKKLVTDTIENIKPTVEKKIGQKLSNKEVMDLANQTSKILKDTVDRKQTLDWEAGMLNARRQLAAASEKGTVDRAYIDNLKTIKTAGTDIARKLQSLSIEAAPHTITAKQTILEAVLKVTDNVDEILKAAEGVDFTNFKEAAEFYRKFVEPTKSEWIDLLRYNSMLSSPNTHIMNVFSNFMNSFLVAPIEKTVGGGFDFLKSTFTGKDRAQFAGEGAVYAFNYLKNTKEAFNRFTGVMKGTRENKNLDVKHVPISTTGVKGKIVDILSFPTRLLEGADQFFSALVEGGETGALKYREKKGVKVDDIASKAESDASYRLYRQDLFNDRQGTLLDAVDRVTNLVNTARNSQNPIVSNVAKFTIPFLKTPMNIFKQGIEYSPAGFLTMFKSKNTMEQFTKAMIGTAVFSSAATLLGSNRITWAEPTSEKERNEFRAQGKQAYSIKIGDTWYSYEKLPPTISFPFAMVAAIDDLQKKSKITDDMSDLILGGVAKYGKFLADQSYAKNVGDLISAVEGGEASVSKLISNYPQQLVPYKGLSGWISRVFDDTQRKVDKDASFVDKQVQQLMMNIPGLTDNLPARTDSGGKPIKVNNRIINLFSPVKTSTEKSTPVSKLREKQAEQVAKLRKAKEDQIKTLRKQREKQLELLRKNR